VIASLRSRRRGFAVGVAILAIVAVGAAALFVGPGSGVPAATAAASPTPADTAFDTSFGVADPTASPSGATADPTASPTAGPFFQPIDLFAVEPPPTPAPPGAPGKPTRPIDLIPLVDPGRDIPDQSIDWLRLKAAGRIVLSNGKIGVLDPGVYPLNDPLTGKPVATARLLDTSWSRWIVEPPAFGKDVKGNTYSDLTYWNLCGPGASTVALYYWQRLTGHPNVTGTAGYFLDPYVAAGVAWPSKGPTFVSPSGTAHRLGTYWTGSARTNGFTAHGRGFIMYLAMAVKPAGWTSPGIDVFVSGLGKALYPTRGSPPPDMEAALNWEASGHAADWADTYYATVHRWDPTLARDLTAAVMLDVGRDGVPVVVAADTFGLPNWQNGSKTPHTRHAIAIVGYDNTAKPPTFTYLDTCGRSCNSRAGNQNGQVHVISQAQMVAALTADNGMSFTW
jgi:hypothetical protein